MIRCVATVFSFLLLESGLAAAQEPAAPEFEAASVKPSEHTGRILGPKGTGTYTYWGCSGGPGWTDPIRYTCTNVGLRHLIETAWDLKSYQLIAPDALDGPTYDVAAKLPVGATKDQFKQMLQRLLIDRFHLVVHHEMREQPVYVLTVGKDGHKLQTPKPGDTETWRDALDNNPNGDGKAKTPDGPSLEGRARLRSVLEQIEAGRPTRVDLAPARIGLRISNGVTKLAARRATVIDLTHALSAQLGCPVVDHTGLSGEWNFIVEYGSTGPPASLPMASLRPPGTQPDASSTEPSAPTGGQSISTAFQKQLGLELKAAKEPADIVVVDKFDKTPVAN